jgi:N-acetylglucosamine-6-phosphate deacetylase
VSLAGVNLQETIQMITSTPARICGVYDQRGSIAVGKLADLVIFDDQIKIHKTIINGNIVYTE